MSCECNKQSTQTPIQTPTQTIKNSKFEKLSLDTQDNTKIMAGFTEFTIQQLEDEIDNPNSEIGRKLRSVEAELEKY